MSDTLWQREDELGVATAHDEGYMLMSLALDGLLESEDEARLMALVAEDETLGEAWRQWQRMDSLFETAPHAVPAGDFVARFEVQLDRRERRLRTRQRALFAVAATMGWLGALAILVALGWYLSMNQAQWMSDFVRELVYYPSAVSIWMRAVQSSFSATVSEPQSMAIACGYAASTALLLAAWLWFLRRTTHEEVVA